MKLAGISLLMLFATLFCSYKAQAQTNLFNLNDLSSVNVDNYSDEDINSMLTKANAAGVSESQLFTLVAERGLPSAEIIKLRKRLQFINKSKQPLPNNNVVDDSNQDTKEPHEYDTSGIVAQTQKFKNDESIFGSELFTSSSLVFEPNLRIPAPSNYILGPDDEIMVSVYGYSEKKYNLKVNEQGEVYIPNVGPILVSGLSIEQAGEKIKSKLASTIYRAIKSGQTKVQISLGKIRSLRVTVIGQAKKPGNFTVSSLTTLYNVLYLCGGPTAMGSYRDIEVIRGNTKRGEKIRLAFYRIK